MQKIADQKKIADLCAAQLPGRGLRSLKPGLRLDRRLIRNGAIKSVIIKPQARRLSDCGR